jgi:hypothetical protein
MALEEAVMGPCRAAGINRRSILGILDLRTFGLVVATKVGNIADDVSRQFGVLEPRSSRFQRS